VYTLSKNHPNSKQDRSNFYG